MAKEIKILWVSAYHETEVRSEHKILYTVDAEKELTRLVNDGWTILTAGGGYGVSGAKTMTDFGGFVILQREK
jgi:hypothetical protein